MAEKIKYSLNVQVVGGTSIPITGEISAEAYGKIQVTVPATPDNLEVNLQPDGTDLAQFLLIKASSYYSTLTYKVNDAEESTPAISLDGPHLFIGSGAVGILASSLTKLFFSNSSGEDVTVDILIGRDATP